MESDHLFQTQLIDSYIICPVSIIQYQHFVLLTVTLPKATISLQVITTIPCDTNITQVPRIKDSQIWSPYLLQPVHPESFSCPWNPLSIAVLNEVAAMQWFCQGELGLPTPLVAQHKKDWVRWSLSVSRHIWPPMLGNALVSSLISEVYPHQLLKWPKCCSSLGYYSLITCLHP